MSRIWCLQVSQVCNKPILPVCTHSHSSTRLGGCIAKAISKLDAKVAEEKVEPKCPNTNKLAWKLRVLTIAMFNVYVHHDNFRWFNVNQTCGSWLAMSMTRYAPFSLASLSLPTPAFRLCLLLLLLFFIVSVSFIQTHVSVPAHQQNLSVITLSLPEDKESLTLQRSKRLCLSPSWKYCFNLALHGSNPLNVSIYTEMYIQHTAHTFLAVFTSMLNPNRMGYSWRFVYFWSLTETNSQIRIDWWFLSTSPLDPHWTRHCGNAPSSLLSSSRCLCLAL